MIEIPNFMEMSRPWNWITVVPTNDEKESSELLSRTAAETVQGETAKVESVSWLRLHPVAINIQEQIQWLLLCCNDAVIR